MVLLNVSQAAELLKVNPKTVRRWEKTGKIQSIKTAGGHLRFESNQLIGVEMSEELIEAQNDVELVHSKNLISIKEAAQLLGISTKTLRRWEEEGKIQAVRTIGGHRRFDAAKLVQEELIRTEKKEQVTVCYCRVTEKEKEELQKNVFDLEQYCSHQGWNYEVITDISGNISGSDGLRKLLNLIYSQKLNRLVLPNLNSILELRADLLFLICQIRQIEVVVPSLNK